MIEGFHAPRTVLRDASTLLLVHIVTKGVAQLGQRREEVWSTAGWEAGAETLPKVAVIAAAATVRCQWSTCKAGKITPFEV